MTNMAYEYIKEVQKAGAALAEEIGDFSALSVTIYPHRIVASAYFAPEDGRRYGGKDFTSAEGKAPLKAIEALRAKWVEQKERREAEVRKTTALAIIRITFEHGKCTDAALRCEVSQTLTPELIEAATSMANEMAEGGPFSVLKIRGANAA